MKSRCLGGGQVRRTAVEEGIAAAKGKWGCGGGWFVWWRLTLRSESGAIFVIVYLAQLYKAGT